MKLSKTVPARRLTESFQWLKKDFMEYGDFRKVREGYGMKVKKECFWCKHKFVDEDMLALAGLKKGNKLICQGCAEEAEKSV